MKDLIIIALLLLVMALVYLQQKENKVEDSSTSITTVYGDGSVEDKSAENKMPKEHFDLNVSLPSALDASKSLLVNGDFESNLSGWDYQAGVYWSNNGGEERGAGLLINAPEVVTESRRIYSKAASQCVNIDGGATYAIEASFRYLDKLPSRASVNRAHLYWYDALDCAAGGQYGTYLEPNLQQGRWQKVLKQGLRPSLGARSAKIVLEQRQEGNNNAEALWDNVVFLAQARSRDADYSQSGSEELTLRLGENYIKNPGFKTDLSHWRPTRSKRLKWQSSEGAANGGVIAATLPNERDASIGTGSFSQCVNFGTEQRFELGAKVKIDARSTRRGGGRLRPTWYEGADCKGRHRTSNSHVDVNKDARGWQSLYMGDLKPAKGSKSVSVSIIHSIEGRGQHTMLWDDFYFRAY